MKYLFLILLFILPIQADAVWFSSDWDYKVKVEVNPNKVGTTTAVTSFPVYLDLAGMPASFWTNASNTGADIRVVESDDTTETAFELVTFATTTKRGELHFMADSLGTTSTSTFYIYYGNATATAYAVTDTYGRNAVWSGYTAVYHMEADMTDSTGGTTGTDTSVTYATAGKIGDGGTFSSGANSRSSVGSIGGSSVAQSTISLWGNPNRNISTDNIDQTFIGYNAWTGNGQFFMGMTTRSGLHKNRVNFYVYGENPDTSSNAAYLSSEIPASGFVKIDAQIDTSTKKKTFYLNGAFDKTTSAYTTIPNVKLDNVNVGGWASAVGWRSLNGTQDELRVSESILSSTWISTEYNNQSSTSTFFWIGPEETNATSSPSATSDEIIWFD